MSVQLTPMFSSNGARFLETEKGHNPEVADFLVASTLNSLSSSRWRGVKSVGVRTSITT